MCLNDFMIAYALMVTTFNRKRPSSNNTRNIVSQTIFHKRLWHLETPLRLGRFPFGSLAFKRLDVYQHVDNIRTLLQEAMLDG